MFLLLTLNKQTFAGKAFNSLFVIFFKNPIPQKKHSLSQNEKVHSKPVKTIIAKYKAIANIKCTHKVMKQLGFRIFCFCYMNAITLTSLLRKEDVGDFWNYFLIENLPVTASE